MHHLIKKLAMRVAMQVMKKWRILSPSQQSFHSMQIMQTTRVVPMAVPKRPKSVKKSPKSQPISVSKITVNLNSYALPNTQSTINDWYLTSIWNRFRQTTQGFMAEDSLKRVTFTTVRVKSQSLCMTRRTRTIGHCALRLRHRTSPGQSLTWMSLPMNSSWCTARSTHMSA